MGEARGGNLDLVDHGKALGGRPAKKWPILVILTPKNYNAKALTASRENQIFRALVVRAFAL